MVVEDIEINKLIPAEYNPRALSEKEKRDLLASLQGFGMVEPIVVNKAKGRENIIIGGHQRYYVLKERGDKTIPVVYVEISDLKREQELNLRLNKNSGHWEWDLLANFDEEFLKDVGFVSEEMDRIFKGIKEDEDPSRLLNDEEIESKLGQVYQLGRHRLACGDSTDPEIYKKLFGDKKAKLIYTDPPYNVGYDYTVTKVEGRKRNSPFTTFNDSRPDAEFAIFIHDVFSLAGKYLMDAGCFYCWHATMTAHTFREGLLKAGFHISQIIQWLKDRPTFSKGLDYLYITEPCFFGWKKGGKHYYNKMFNLEFENILSVNKEDFPKLLDVLYEKRDDMDEYMHPTQKPINLANTPIIRHSQRDDIVLDMFGGSGSTLLACEQLQRVCYMIELDPKFCDVIRRRYATFVGKEHEWQKITPEL